MRVTWPQFRSLAVAGSLAFAFQSMAACNAVLDIEPARHDESFGKNECPNRQPPPRTDCAPAPDRCLDKCAVDDCLKDHECRAALYDYRQCLGKACTDQNRDCWGCVSENAKAKALVQCLEDNECQAAIPVSMCELYCACMDAQCPSQAPDGIGSTGSCLEACQGGATPTWRAAHVDTTVQFSWEQPLDSWRAYCLWEHCELAYKSSFAHHCEHAIGKLSWCQTPPQADPSAPECAPGLRRDGAPCNVNEDCCSGLCDSETSACLGS